MSCWPSTGRRNGLDTLIGASGGRLRAFGGIAPRSECLVAARARPAGRSAPAWQSASWRAELTQPDYEARVGRVLRYIRDGDIFQANFSFSMRHRASRQALAEAS